MALLKWKRHLYRFKELPMSLIKNEQLKRVLSITLTILLIVSLFTFQIDARAVNKVTCEFSAYHGYYYYELYSDEECNNLLGYVDELTPEVKGEFRQVGKVKFQIDLVPGIYYIKGAEMPPDWGGELSNPEPYVVAAPAKVTCEFSAYHGYYYYELYSDEECNNLLGYVDELTPEVKGEFRQVGKVKFQIDLEPGTYYIKGAEMPPDWGGELSAPEPYVVTVEVRQSYTTRFDIKVNKYNQVLSAQEVYKKQYGDNWEEYFNAANFIYGGELKVFSDSEVELSKTEISESEDISSYTVQATIYEIKSHTVKFVFTPYDSRFCTVETDRTFTNTGTSSVVLNPLFKTERTFTVNREYANGFSLYEKGNMHYARFTKINPLSKIENSDGTVTFAYDIPVQTTVHYTIDNVKDNIKLSRTWGFSVETPSDVVVRGYSNVASDYKSEEGMQSDNWTHFELNNDLRMNMSPVEGNNLYLGFSTDKTAQNSHMVNVNSGDSFQLDSYRTWQAVGSVTGNYFIEPDFHYEVVGNSVALSDCGKEGREYETVTATGDGVSVIKVTYDAMYFAAHGIAMDSWWEGENSCYYDAIDPENTGIVIVNVGGKNDTNIQPNLKNPSSGLALTEYDTFYFDRTAGSVDYTFTPTADADMTVSVHDPLHNTTWGDAWTTYTADENGAYTVNLKDGRNILKISTADGSEVYWVINARAVDVNVKNLTSDDGIYHIGDEVEVRIDGMYLPIQKMAGIYNPNYPANGWIEYKTADGETHKSVGSQYNAVTAGQSKITYTITADCLNENDEYIISDGVIHNEHLGSALGAHHSIPLEGVAPNLNASGGANEPWFCTLPVITLDVDTTNLECANGKHYGGTEIKDAVEATCTSTGYSGDTYCKKCGEKLSDGEMIEALGHDYTIPGISGSTHWLSCSVCGAIDPDSYTQPEEPKPSTGSVRVIVENNTYKVAEGAPWDGILVDEWVTLNDNSTMMSCIVSALINHGYTQTGAENNYISKINGLGEFDGGNGSGWMGTLNDWFTNEGFGAFTVANGKLADGDIIEIMYTCKLGADLGSSFDSNDTRLAGLTISGGKLSPDFDSDKTEYTLTISGNRAKVEVGPTAMNKNFMVKTFLNEKVTGNEEGSSFYKRTETIPVNDGDVIYIGVGEAAWPTMNEGAEGTWYTVKVVGSGSAPAPGGSETKPETQPLSFVDVAEGSYYADAVAWAVANGITDGVDKTHFAPDASCTRAQVVTFLWRAAGAPEPTATKCDFVDLDENAYYFKAVLWAVENGITDGVDATHFAPDATVTRAQVVTLQYRASKAEAEGNNSFVDVPAGAYYEDAVNWAVKSGITNGVDETHFAPNASCTRAQIVTFLYRAAK